MKFLLMLVQDACAWDEEPQAENDRAFNEHTKVCALLEAQGKLLGSQRLRPSKEAKTVRTLKGKHVVTDGPYCETREQTGGSYLIECASMDEAIKWAMKMPHFGNPDYSAIEVRPIWDRSHPEHCAHRTVRISSIGSRRSESPGRVAACGM
jgi:hypothetical protein